MAGVTAVSSWAGAATTAKSEYQAALKAASAQNVHYVSKANEPGIGAITAIGDTGKTSGSIGLQVINGSKTESLKVLLVGSTGYVRGNEVGLEKALGLTAAQSTDLREQMAVLSHEQHVVGGTGHRTPRRRYPFRTPNVGAVHLRLLQDDQRATCQGDQGNGSHIVRDKGPDHPLRERVGNTASGPRGHQSHGEVLLHQRHGDVLELG